MAYAPDAEAFGVAAKALGEDSTKWRDALRGVCATRGAAITEGLALAYVKPVAAGAVDFDEPLLRNVADELAALKRRVDRRVAELPPIPLADGASAQLQPSTAARFVDGGYATKHYVATPPDRNEACVELLLNDANGRRTLSWQNDDGDTALHLACFGAPAAALVLAKAGAPRDVLNNREETPDDLARRAAGPPEHGQDRECAEKWPRQTAGKVPAHSQSRDFSAHSQPRPYRENRGHSRGPRRV